MKDSLHERLLNPPADTTGTARFAGWTGEIPDDLLQEASRRLGLVSLLGVVLWSVGMVLDHLALRALLPAGDPYWRRLHPPDFVVLLAVLASLGLFGFSRTTGRSPRFILDLGLVYLVVNSLAIGIIWHWRPVTAGRTLEPMFTWVGPLVLIFAAIIPNPPWKTLLAGLVAVSMNPLGMLLARAQGTWDFGSSTAALLMHYPDYIMVGVSVVISRVVSRLGQHVSRAREMGSYHIGELLGRGGMGEVYLATHRMLARPAAIKLIRPETLGGEGAAAADQAIRRFRREAEAAASLRSPHTVELYDFGVTEDRTLYFVMEFLVGMDLEKLVRTHGPQPASRVISILRQVTESLEEAHARGLVHRDIKPANIHIGRLGLRHDFVKVLDFGLVKEITPGGQASLETELETPGTPSYMAPELILGEPVDGRADLYALGCVGYFLLTGTVVFEASTVLQALARQVNDTPVPPSERSGRPVPPALEQIILSLLAKRPDDRPASATELGERLAAIDTNPWTETHAAEWWREIEESN